MAIGGGSYASGGGRSVDYKQLYVNNLNWAARHLDSAFLLDVTELSACKKRMEEYGAYCEQEFLDGHSQKANDFFDAFNRLEKVPDLNLLDNDNSSGSESYLDYNDKKEAVSLAQTDFHKPGSKLTGKFKLPNQFVFDCDSYNKTYTNGLTKVKLVNYVTEANSQPKEFFDNDEDMRKKFHDLLVEKSTGVRSVRRESGCVIS